MGSFANAGLVGEASFGNLVDYRRSELAGEKQIMEAGDRERDYQKGNLKRKENGKGFRKKCLLYSGQNSIHLGEVR